MNRCTSDSQCANGEKCVSGFCTKMAADDPADLDEAPPEVLPDLAQP